MSQDTAERAKRWFRDVWGKQRSDAAIDVLSVDDVVQHNADGTIVSSPEWKAFRRQLIDAVPDLDVAVENVVANGDEAVVRWRFTGTHRGTVFGVAGSGRPIDVVGMTWLRFRDGKIVEGWDAWNVGGLVQHLSQPAAAMDRSAAG